MMIDWIVMYEPLIRLGLFVGSLILFGLLELRYPKFPRFRSSVRKRWVDHLFLVAVGTAVGRVLLQMVPVTFALLVQERKLGVFSNLHWPYPVIILISIFALDFLMFLGHRTFHRLPFLWQVHKVHHIDKALDVTTGVRFHPFEIVILLFLKSIGILFLAAPALAVFIYEVMFCFFLQFAHANVAIPEKLNQYLRYLLVTPETHRIHHSDIPREQNSNFGFCFSIWDRLFGCYKKIADTSARYMVFGLEGYFSPRFETLSAMISLPFNLKRFSPQKVWSTPKMRE
ncbi:MAG: sterol desaturase family protein [Gammaproteobacteria bacterium]